MKSTNQTNSLRMRSLITILPYCKHVQIYYENELCSNILYETLFNK